MSEHGVRKITNHGRNRVIGKFVSLKMNRIVKWESQIERDCCFWLEFDKDVISYHSQPLVVSYIFEDRRLRHIPDFEVVRRSLQTKQYIEVKPYKKTLEDEFRRKHIARTAHFHLQGNEYVLMTDEHLRKGHFLKNIQSLYRYARLIIDPTISLHVKNAFPEGSKLSFAALQDQCVAFGAEAQLAHFLLYHGAANFDMNEPISLDTEIEMTWSRGDYSL